MDNSVHYISGIRQCVRLLCTICHQNGKKATHACHFWTPILSKNFSFTSARIVLQCMNWKLGGVYTISELLTFMQKFPGPTIRSGHQRRLPEPKHPETYPSTLTYLSKKKEKKPPANREMLVPVDGIYCTFAGFCFCITPVPVHTLGRNICGSVHHA